MFENDAKKLDLAIKSSGLDPFNDGLISLTSLVINFTKYNAYIKNNLPDRALETLEKMKEQFLPEIKEYFSKAEQGQPILSVLAEIEAKIDASIEATKASIEATKARPKLR